MELQLWSRRLDFIGWITVILCQIIHLVLNSVEPNPLYIPQRDPSTSFPHLKRKTLDNSVFHMLTNSVVFIVILVMFFISRFFPRKLRRFNPFSALCAALIASSLTQISASFLSQYVGKALPDTGIICPNAQTTCSPTLFGAWPSKESAFLTSCGTFLTLFIQEVCLTHNYFLGFIPIVFQVIGLFIGAVRIKEFSGLPEDVLCGYFIGYIFTGSIWKALKKRVFSIEVIIEKAGSDETEPLIKSYKTDAFDTMV